jgi:ribosomal protein S18 acetylase RimI-like enzyme
MINTKVAEARQQGYGVFGLDVADTNPRAEKLYRKLGLQMIEFKKFSGRRQGMQIPNSKKLELRL